MNIVNLTKTEFTQKVLETEVTLYRISKTILIREKDCEDAVSEAILKAYEKLDTLREPKYFKTWLVRILINECYRIRRAYHPLVSYEEYFSESLEDTSHTDSPADYSELYQAITRLPSRIGITITLYYIEGYSVEEIKAILHIPAGTVKSRLSKGRKLLKAQLLQMEVTYG